MHGYTQETSWNLNKMFVPSWKIDSFWNYHQIPPQTGPWKACTPGTLGRIRRHILMEHCRLRWASQLESLDDRQRIAWRKFYMKCFCQWSCSVWWWCWGWFWFCSCSCCGCCGCCFSCRNVVEQTILQGFGIRKFWRLKYLTKSVISWGNQGGLWLHIKFPPIVRIQILDNLTIAIFEKINKTSRHTCQTLTKAMSP